MRLLTGLKFANISCNPRCLSKGLTTTVFQSLQKYPSVREILTILVISGMTSESIFFNMVMGIASSSQELLLREVITTLTCFSVIGAKCTRCGTSVSGTLYLFLSVSLIFLSCLGSMKQSPWPAGHYWCGQATPPLFSYL